MKLSGELLPHGTSTPAQACRARPGCSGSRPQIEAAPGRSARSGNLISLRNKPHAEATAHMKNRPYHWITTTTRPTSRTGTRLAGTRSPRARSFSSAARCAVDQNPPPSLVPLEHDRAHHRGRRPYYESKDQAPSLCPRVSEAGTDVPRGTSVPPTKPALCGWGLRHRLEVRCSSTNTGPPPTSLMTRASAPACSTWNFFEPITVAVAAPAPRTGSATKCIEQRLA